MVKKKKTINKINEKQKNKKKLNYEHLRQIKITKFK